MSYWLPGAEWTSQRRDAALPRLTSNLTVLIGHEWLDRCIVCGANIETWRCHVSTAGLL